MKEYDDYEQMEPEEQARVFRESPVAEKSELIRHSHHPEELTRSLSHEELYLVVRELDLEERSEIIRHATLPQLFFIADMDCWHRDRLNISGFLNWMEVLLVADEQRLLAWMLQADIETIVTGFQGLIEVLKPDWEDPPDDILGGRPYFSIDQRYFILASEDNLQVVRRAIQLMFEHANGRYVALMEGVMSEVTDMLEEEAYRCREARMAERGFPDIESAMRIYRPITEEEFMNFPRKDDFPVGSSLGEGIIRPDYLTIWAQDRAFIDKVLLRLREQSPDIEDAIEEELMWLSNKVIASEGVDFSSEEQIQRGIERVHAVLSLGLDRINEGSVDKALEMVCARWLEIIFRKSVTLLYEMRYPAEQLVHKHWNSSQDDFIEFIGEPYEFIFRGLFQKIPEFFDSSLADASYPFRDFKSMQEIENTEKSITQIVILHELLSKIFPEDFKGLCKTVCDVQEIVTMKSALGAMMVHQLMSKELILKPIDFPTVKKFYREWFEPQGDRLILKQKAKETFLESWVPKQQQDVLQSLLGIVYQELEEEGRSFLASKDVDSRFFQAVWLDL